MSDQHSTPSPSGWPPPGPGEATPYADSDGRTVLLTIPTACVATGGWPRPDVHLVHLGTEAAANLADQLHDAVSTVEAAALYDAAGDTDPDPADLTFRYLEAPPPGHVVTVVDVDVATGRVTHREVRW